MHRRYGSMGLSYSRYITPGFEPELNGMLCFAIVTLTFIGALPYNVQTLQGLIIRVFLA
jgi:hypothetical protein